MAPISMECLKGLRVVPNVKVIAAQEIWTNGQDGLHNHIHFHSYGLFRNGTLVSTLTGAWWYGDRARTGLARSQYTVTK